MLDLPSVSQVELLEKIGEGATSLVYRGHWTGSSKPVAVKVFREEYGSSLEFQGRVQREANWVQSLEHPNVVKLLEARLDADKPCLIMEWIEGESLDVFQPRLPYVLPELSVLIVIEILKGLEAAHAKGLIHRDLKPRNILISPTGRVVITDFGLAKNLSGEQTISQGTLIGSPDFMSPEQAEGAAVDERSDLFSVGALFYFLVTGTKPFARESAWATLTAIRDGKFERPTQLNPKLRTRLGQILLKALETDPKARFASALEFRNTLEGSLRDVGLSSLTLETWLKAPSETLLLSLRKMAEALAADAELQLAKGEVVKTQLLCAELSLVAPQSEKLRRLFGLLETTRPQERSKRGLLFWGGITAATVTAGILFLLGRESLQTDTPSNTVSTSVLENTSSATAAEPPPTAEPVHVSETPTEKPTAATPLSEKPASIAASKPSPGQEVVFDVPKNVSVFWNGKKIKNKTTLLDQRIGKHHLKLVMAGKPPVETKVDVVAHEPTVIRVR